MQYFRTIVMSLPASPLLNQHKELSAPSSGFTSRFTQYLYCHHAIAQCEVLFARATIPSHRIVYFLAAFGLCLVLCFEFTAVF